MNRSEEASILEQAAICGDVGGIVEDIAKVVGNDNRREWVEDWNA